MKLDADSTEKRKRAVMDLSVYNALNGARTDLPIDMIVAFLRTAWQPAWGPVDEVVTDASVTESVGRLRAHKLVGEADGKVTIPVRGFGGVGRPLALNAERTELLL